MWIKIQEIILLTIAMIAAILVGAFILAFAGLLLIEEKFTYWRRKVEWKKWLLKKQK